MKRIILSAAALMLAASCTSKSGQLLAGTKKVKVLEVVYDGNGKVSALPGLSVLNVDTLFNAGDTIYNKPLSKMFVIQKN